MSERTSYLVHVHYFGKDGIRGRKSFLVANALNSHFAGRAIFGDNRGLRELAIFKVDIQEEQYSRVIELKD